MKRRIHRSACAALALIALGLTGAVTQCPWKSMVVKIPDLETNQIQGLQLWRADDKGSQSFTAAAQVVFGECFLESGMEQMQYTMVDSQNQPIDFLAPARVIREENGMTILVFFFAGWREPPGWIRVTTFNGVGESELSEEAIFI